MKKENALLNKKSLHEPTIVFYIAILIITLLILAGLIRLGVQVQREMMDERWLVSIIVFLVFPVGPYCYLAASYFIEEIKQDVSFNTTSNEIVVKRNGETISITHNEVVDCYHIKVNRYGSRLKCHGFEYVLIILKERKRVYITNLRCTPKEVIGILKINPKELHYKVPILKRHIGDINQTTNEFVNSVNEFYERYKEKSDEQLLSICSQKNVYTPYAIKAARKLLIERADKRNKN